MNDNKESNEWGGFIREFFWICAGVNRDILRQCPTEYSKYVGVGGIILGTAVMAALSAGYALNSVFNDTSTSIFFGCFWGLLIFNLDRYIVNTMYSDGKVTISWQEFKCGLPRIIMALFLGVVISTPLELKIFEDAIDIKLEQDKDFLVNERIKHTVQERDSIASKKDEVMNGVTMFDSQMTTNNIQTNALLSDIQSLQKKLGIVNASINKLNGELASLSHQIDKTNPNDSRYSSISKRINNIKYKRNSEINKRNDLASEIREKTGQAAASNQTLNKLAESKQKETSKECARLQTEVDSLNRIISEANTRHNDWSEDKIKEQGSFRDKLDVEYKGFQAKMKAFSELKEESTSTQISALFIMLLFVIIETAPTFFKMMTASGPYDDMLRAEMHRVKNYSERKIKEYDAEINIENKKINSQLEAELNANKEFITQLSKAQADIIQSVIAEWKEQTMAEVKKEPSKYITMNNNGK